VSVPAFLSELRRLDIRVWAEGETLRCNARPGALTDDLREELRQRKADIVSFLQQGRAIAAQQGALVALQGAGTRTPIFAVPPHSGDVFAFRALARALGTERPFFGLQPPGLDGARAPLDRVEDLAAYFEAQIRAVRPRGPWILGGFCMGGTVAFELAQRLLAGRRDAGFLVLFGAPHPNFFRAASLLRHELGNRVSGWRRRVALLAGQSGQERLDYLRWRMRLHREPVDPVLALRAKVEQATLAAVRAYEPAPFAGHLQLLVPSRTWAQRSRSQIYRWTSLAATAESAFGPEGCNADNMLLGPHAAIFAAHLRQAFAQGALHGRA
jgi:thioesterase domain-containing protein